MISKGKIEVFVDFNRPTRARGAVMNITNFLIMNSDGEIIDGDPHGNNLAFVCEACGYPILAIARDYQRGSSEDYPVECKGCGLAYFLDIRPSSEKLYIHPVHRP